MSRVLGLFAKWPDSGQVKTRLAAESSSGWAAEVATAFLLDTVERLAKVHVQRILAFTPRDAELYFSDLVRGRFRLTPQKGDDLGERMRAFCAEQLQAGAASVVLVGTDSPTLPVTLVEQAFRELEQADVVLGPATDGGYYLVGCARRLPPIFHDMAWGSRRVLADTVARLAGAGWRLALLPPWYDIDTLDDWQMLQGHLAALRHAGLDPELPHTSGVRDP